MIEIDGQERPVAEVLEQVLTLQESDVRLAGAEEREKDLVRTIDGLTAEKVNKGNDVAAKGAEISEKQGKIETKRSEFLRGAALKVKLFAGSTWPYFLITFLGMKIARKKYFIRDAGTAAPGQCRTRTPPGAQTSPERPRQAPPADDPA